MQALLAFDDGAGPALFVGGSFARAGSVDTPGVARWDAAGWSGWSNGGTPAHVRALAEFDGDVYAGGVFSSLGGVPALNIARWDGTAWSAVGGGIFHASPQLGVRALHSLDDGSGPALYAGGDFTLAGGVAALNVARWDGTSWSALGAGVAGPSSVLAFTTFDVRQGPRLFAAAGSQVAHWSGAAWVPLSAPVPHPVVTSLAVFDHGATPRLHVGTALGVVSWNGAGAWDPVGAIPSAAVRTLYVDDITGTKRLYAGRQITSDQGVAALVAWDGVDWEPAFDGDVEGVDFLRVGAIERFDTGIERALVVGGWFQGAGGTNDHYVARWLCGESGFAAIPGCVGNPAVLSATSTALAVGKPLSLALSAPFTGGGSALLFVGAEGTDALGCGAWVPGLGELLLAPVPAPFALVDAPLVAGAATFFATTPAAPSLVGLEFTFQAAAVGTDGAGTELALSNALLATMGP